MPIDNITPSAHKYLVSAGKVVDVLIRIIYIYIQGQYHNFRWPG